MIKKMEGKLFDLANRLLGQKMLEKKMLLADYRTQVAYEVADPRTDKKYLTEQCVKCKKKFGLGYIKFIDNNPTCLFCQEKNKK